MSKYSVLVEVGGHLTRETIVEADLVFEEDGMVTFTRSCTCEGEASPKTAALFPVHRVVQVVKQDA